MSDATRLTIIRAGGPVFGSSLDAMAFEIDARIRPEDRAGFENLVETWPLDGQGDPVDGAALYAALLALRRRRMRRHEAMPQGSTGAAVAGLLIGGAAGLPAGFILYMVLRAVALPTSLWSSDAVQWGVTVAVMVVFGGVGFWQGGWPNRLGGALRAAFYGFLGGAILGAVVGGTAAALLGEWLGVSQREGAFAMGVMFGVAPLAGLLGGVIMGTWRAWRAWSA